MLKTNIYYSYHRINLLTQFLSINIPRVHSPAIQVSNFQIFNDFLYGCSSHIMSAYSCMHLHIKVLLLAIHRCPYIVYATTNRQKMSLYWSKCSNMENWKIPYEPTLYTKHTPECHSQTVSTVRVKQSIFGDIP